MRSNNNPYRKTNTRSSVERPFPKKIKINNVNKSKILNKTPIKNAKNKNNRDINSTNAQKNQENIIKLGIPTYEENFLKSEKKLKEKNKGVDEKIGAVGGISKGSDKKDKIAAEHKVYEYRRYVNKSIIENKDQKEGMQKDMEDKKKKEEGKKIIQQGRQKKHQEEKEKKSMLKDQGKQQEKISQQSNNKQENLKYSEKDENKKTNSNSKKENIESKNNQLNASSKIVKDLEKVNYRISKEIKINIMGNSQIRQENSQIRQENARLNQQIERLREQYEAAKKENDELKKKSFDVMEVKKNKSIYNPENKYDIAVKIYSLKDLINGWTIKYNENGSYFKLKNEKMLIIGLIGLKNSGKSFIASKIAKDKIVDKKDSDYLYLKYVVNNDFKVAIIDSPGFSRSMKRRDLSKENINNIIVNNSEKKEVEEMGKNHILTDNFLSNFILKKSHFLIVVVGSLNLYEQQLLMKLKSKDEEHEEAFKELKKIFVLHNLKELSKIEEIKDHLTNVLLNSMTFKLNEKESQLIEAGDKSKNSKYYIEKNENKLIEICHLILAKDNSEAGNYYNDFTINMIHQQYNFFHSYNSLDLINDLKKEIIGISDKIFVKPLKSLEDFENIEDKIKVKKEFEYLSNTQENSDFSFIHLKPKYSYYKIENGTNLLVKIEMAGKIIDQKLTCSGLKNGYYTMKFSGKKVLELPANFEMEKKNGLLFNNREEGEFKETFKIKQDKFPLKSYKYIKEESEGNGVYKYYFELMIDNPSSDEEDRD